MYRNIMFASVVTLAACSTLEMYDKSPFADDEVVGCDTGDDTGTDDTGDTADSDDTADTADTDGDTGDDTGDTATTEDEPSSCWGYEIEVVGSDYLEPGWWCLPARPYFNLIGEEVIESNIDVREMTWVIEIDASPEADINMDVIALDFDVVFNDVDWFEELNESEIWRWSAVTDNGDALIAQPVLASDHWLTLVIVEPNAGWDPAVIVPQGGSRQIEITLDTTGMAFAPGDSMTASFNNYQTWETGDGVVPRIFTDHEEFPIMGTSYEITVE